MKATFVKPRSYVTISVKVPVEMNIQLNNIVRSRRMFMSKSEFIRHAIIFCLSRKECVERML